MFKYIDADYYGYRDEDDGILLPLEAEAEALAVEQAEREWNERQGASAAEPEDELDDVLYADGAAADVEDRQEERMELDEDTPEAAKPADIPTMEDMEKLLLTRKKQMLLAQYASADLQAEVDATKSLATHAT